MSYSRWKRHYPTSWVYQEFSSFHSDINNMYWANASTKELVTRELNRISDDSIEIASVLSPVATEATTRAPRKKGEWTKAYNEFEKWVLLSALLSASSYLELYLKKGISTALISDPGVASNRAKSLDGMLILKNYPGFEEDQTKKSEKCIKGDWPARLGAFRRLFTVKPNLTKFQVEQLEEIRHTRNKFGHVFGKETDGIFATEYKKSYRFVPLAQTKLQEYLGTIEATAKAYEVILGKSIGDFEPLNFYRLNAPKYSKLHSGEVPTALKMDLTKKGFTVSRPYCRELVEYFRGL